MSNATTGPDYVVAGNEWRAVDLNRWRDRVSRVMAIMRSESHLEAWEVECQIAYEFERAWGEGPEGAQ